MTKKERMERAEHMAEVILRNAETRVDEEDAKTYCDFEHQPCAHFWLLSLAQQKKELGLMIGILYGACDCFGAPTDDACRLILQYRAGQMTHERAVHNLKWTIYDLRS